MAATSAASIRAMVAAGSSPNRVYSCRSSKPRSFSEPFLAPFLAPFHDPLAARLAAQLALVILEPSLDLCAHVVLLVRGVLATSELEMYQQRCGDALLPGALGQGRQISQRLSEPAASPSRRTSNVARVLGSSEITTMRSARPQTAR